MDAVEIGTLVGAAIAFLASGRATLVARRAENRGEDPGVSALRERVSRSEDENERLREENKRLEKRIAKAEDRLGSTVSEEEFASYTTHTTQSLQGLTDRVGRVTGALEAWAQQNRGR